MCGMAYYVCFFVPDLRPAFPLQQGQGGLEGALRSAEGEAEPEVGELVLQLDAEPLLDLGELLFLLLGDSPHPVRPEHTPKSVSHHSVYSCFNASSLTCSSGHVSSLKMWTNVSVYQLKKYRKMKQKLMINVRRYFFNF